MISTGHIVVVILVQHHDLTFNFRGAGRYFALYLSGLFGIADGISAEVFLLPNRTVIVLEEGGHNLHRTYSGQILTCVTLIEKQNIADHVYRVI